jgi:hypothetical protein
MESVKVITSSSGRKDKGLETKGIFFESRG